MHIAEYALVEALKEIKALNTKLNALTSKIDSVFCFYKNNTGQEPSVSLFHREVDELKRLSEKLRNNNG